MTAFDTNVLIYACDKADPRRQTKALSVLSSTQDGVLLWQVACEFIAASRKLAPQGFTSEHAWNRMSEFIELFPLIVPNPSALDLAREFHLSRRWSFWDATIVAACITGGVSRLYTEDLPGNNFDSIEFVNPFA